MYPPCYLVIVPLLLSVFIDNSNQMAKICPTCVSVCDLCRNSLFWEQDSRFGLYEMAIVQGTRYIPTVMSKYGCFNFIFVSMN